MTRTDFTLEEKLACIKRELKMRRKAYPRWVAERKGGMTHHQAAYEIACMESIQRDYERTLGEHHPGPGDLFAQRQEH